jgi:hypothetical protein
MRLERRSIFRAWICSLLFPDLAIEVGEAREPEPLPPPTLPFQHLQPMPRFALIVPSVGGRGDGIARGWKPGDARNCRLCPVGKCAAHADAHGDVCLVQVGTRIKDEEALLFSTVGLTWVGHGVYR